MPGDDGHALVVGHRISADGPGAQPGDASSSMEMMTSICPATEIVHRGPPQCPRSGTNAVDGGGILEIEAGDVDAGPQAGVPAVTGFRAGISASEE